MTKTRAGPRGQQSIEISSLDSPKSSPFSPAAFPQPACTEEEDPAPGSAALTATSDRLKHGCEHRSLLNAPPCSWKPSFSLKLAVTALLTSEAHNATCHGKKALKQSDEHLLRVSAIKLQEDRRPQDERKTLENCY